MKYPPIIEHNGKEYMDTKTAAEKWELKQSTITKYCREGKICRAYKRYEARWYVPVDAIKPLSDDEMRKYLIITLVLKNKPTQSIDWAGFIIEEHLIEPTYRYLAFREMIENFDISDNKRIPYEVVLTQKGLELAIDGKKYDLDKVMQFLFSELFRALPNFVHTA